MKKKISLLLSTVLAMSLITSCGAGGNTSTQQPAQSGENGGGTSQANSEASTGKLIIYSPLTESMIDSMIQMFEADTGIDVEVLAMGTGDALKRIETEAAKPQADILWSGTIGTVKSKSDFFADYTCENEDAFYPEYKNVEGNMTRFDTIPSVIMVNNDLIGDIEIKGYQDLLNPALKGKIAFAEASASSSSFEHLVNMLYAMGNGNPEDGWDYVEEFCKQLDGKQLGGSSAVYKGVADGEYVVGLTFEQGAAQYVGAGAPVSVVYMEEGVIFRGDGAYMIKDCPNMDSAQKFLDWLTSYDVQNYMNATQYRRTIRTDVPETEAMAPMSKIHVIEDDESETAAKKSEWLEKFKDIFTDVA